MPSHSPSRSRRVRALFLVPVALVLLTSFAGAAPATQPPAAPSAGAAPGAPTVRRVVIDPGHGGSENGAQGAGGLVEKELTLDVARRLAMLLRVDGFDAILTRDGDDDRALDARAGIANSQHADLFISLHANASRSAAAHGAETYVLSHDATDDAARTTAALENDAAGVTSSGGSEDADLPLILWDLAQVEYLKDSSRLAAVIQERLNDALSLKDRGVRQAPFAVLRGATCPAVLVELGFVTNAEEEKQLASPDYRRRLAEVLAQAVRDFRGAVTRSTQ